MQYLITICCLLFFYSGVKGQTISGQLLAETFRINLKGEVIDTLEYSSILIYNHTKDTVIGTIKTNSEGKFRYRIAKENYTNDSIIFITAAGRRSFIFDEIKEDTNVHILESRMEQMPLYEMPNTDKGIIRFNCNTADFVSD